MKRKNLLLVNLDERVTITLIISFILAVSICFWSFRTSSIEPCIPIQITFPYSVHYTGKTINFKAEGVNTQGKSITWDFGDKTKRSETGNSAYHVYMKPGRYRIKITTDDLCSNDTSINITQQVMVNALIPQEVFTGESFTLHDVTPNAISWKWYYNESGSIVDTIQNPTHIYIRHGQKQITLEVNGNMLQKYDIMVSDKPAQIKITPKPKALKTRPTIIPTNPPVRPRQDTVIIQPNTIVTISTAYIAPTEEYIRNRLYLVVEGKINVYNFQQEVCSTQMSVMYNGNQITFLELCRQLRDIKKTKKIDEFTVKFNTDLKMKCINHMVVTVKLKTWFEVIKGKIFSKK